MSLVPTPHIRWRNQVTEGNPVTRCLVQWWVRPEYHGHSPEWCAKNQIPLGGNEYQPLGEWRIVKDEFS